MSIVIVNPSDQGFWKRKYLLCMGNYSTSYYIIFADCEGDAIDTFIDYASEHEPGWICNDEVNEAYNEAIASGMSEEKAREEAEGDMIQGGNAGDYIVNMDRHCLVESPKREYLMTLAKDNGGFRANL